MNTNWQKSSLSSGGDNCVEYRLAGDGVEVRDSKLADASPVLGFNKDEWQAFLGGVRKGEADIV